jgi:hypothetical protein
MPATLAPNGSADAAPPGGTHAPATGGGAIGAPFRAALVRYPARTVILRDALDETIVVTQADHARLAADLLALLRLPGLADHPRRAELLAAVADHDNGWWEADAAPRVDPGSGRALDFLAIPPALRLEIWRRGVERFAAERPYASALVAAHFLRLSSGRRDDPELAAELARLARRREELLADAARSAAELAGDDRWLALADDLSLAVCAGDAAFVRQPGWRAAVAADGAAVELRLDPFPLAGASRRVLRARRIARRRFTTDGELGRALAAARWEEIPVRVVPLAAFSAGDQGRTALQRCAPPPSKPSAKSGSANGVSAMYCGPAGSPPTLRSPAEGPPAAPERSQTAKPSPASNDQRAAVEASEANGERTGTKGPA